MGVRAYLEEFGIDTVRFRPEVEAALRKVRARRRHWWWRVYYWARGQTPRRRRIRRAVRRSMARPAPSVKVWKCPE